MASTDGSRDSALKSASMGGKSPATGSQDPLAAKAHLNAGQVEPDDELRDSAQTDEEPDTIALLGEDAGGDAVDAEDTAEFAPHDDPDVAAVDKALSSSREQQAADSNSSIRRLLEERTEARRLKQDLDYLDFDD